MKPSLLPMLTQSPPGSIGYLDLARGLAQNWRPVIASDIAVGVDQFGAGRVLNGERCAPSRVECGGLPPLCRGVARCAQGGASPALQIHGKSKILNGRTTRQKSPVDRMGRCRLESCYPAARARADAGPR